jgi:hypothetical protein
MIILPCGFFSYFSFVNFFRSFREDEDPTFNPSSSDDSEQHSDKYESSTVAVVSPLQTLAVGNSDALDGTYVAAEEVTITRMYVSHLCPI